MLGPPPIRPPRVRHRRQRGGQRAGGARGRRRDFLTCQVLHRRSLFPPPPSKGAPPYSLSRLVKRPCPTWRKTQHRGFAYLLGALLERPTLCETELARAWPEAGQPLHGRLKRLTRLLGNPRLDELALAQRWLKLSYHFSADAPTLADG